MRSMHDVPSSLILRNESWVRQHAGSLARRLPSNVEKADLIQAGLIAVAQSALGFVWEGDKDSEEAKEAFVRYARRRVHGAMLDELRQMDHLSRPRRRQVKLVQVARERWRASHGDEPTAETLSRLCGMSIDELFKLEQDALTGQPLGPAVDPDGDTREYEAATPHDEVEARVDTGLVMRRLEGFFAALPERDHQVIDAYLGIGMSPEQLATTLDVTPSRVSQLFRSICTRIGLHLEKPTNRRAVDRVGDGQVKLSELISQREVELKAAGPHGDWSRQLEAVFAPVGADGTASLESEDLVVKSGTRWG